MLFTSAGLWIASDSAWLQPEPGSGLDG